MEEDILASKMVAAKHKNHLSNENVKALFLLDVLKLPAKNRYENE